MRYDAIVPIAAVAALLLTGCHSASPGVLAGTRPMLDAPRSAEDEAIWRSIRERARAAVRMKYASDLADEAPSSARDFWFIANEEGEIRRSGKGFYTTVVAKTVITFDFPRGELANHTITVTWGID